MLRAFVIACALTLVACSQAPTKDIRVFSQLDEKTNLAGFKSYAWAGTAETINDPNNQWIPAGYDTEVELKKLVDIELQKKGLVEDLITPDMLIGMATGIDMEATQVSTDATHSSQTTSNPQGALVIIMVDARNGYPIWAGEAVADVQSSYTDAERRNRLEYAVKKIFKAYP